MNIYKKTIAGLFLSLAFLSSCSNFDNLNTNPNASTHVPSNMLATGMLVDMTKQDQEYSSFIDHNFLSKHALTAELMRDPQYNKLTRSGFGAYGSLRNIEKMVNNASENMKSSYEALGYFLKAYQLFYTSLDNGDIPYSESLMGESHGIIQPKYDTQKEVMLHVLADLDNANRLFATAPNFDGDPILKGDVEKWRKVVNAFKLKVLINLMHKDTDVELNVKAQFVELVTERELLTSNKDNFQLVYSDKGGQIYPFNAQFARSRDYCMLSSNLVDSLKKLKDNRLFYFAEPSVFMINQGKTSAEFDAYISIDPSLPFDQITKRYGNKEHTGLNKRYTDLENPAGEPIVRIGYAEQCFNIAEGMARGWIAGDAKIYYEEGIRAAMDFVKDHTPNKYVSERPVINDEYLTEYLRSKYVAFSDDKSVQLKQIFQQKYFIYFLQNPWDGFYENRRVLYPILPIDPSTNMNQVANQMPKRWIYPQVEYDENPINVKAAIARQFNGKDDNNELMWILKP